MRKAGAHIADLDRRIAELVEQIKDRYAVLKRETDHLADQYQRLTGASLANARVNGATRATGGAPAATAATPVKPATRGKKRTRRPGVDAEWIADQLKSASMTLKQLQDVAAQQGRSELSVMNVLRANKPKFKSERGEKRERVKGVPALIWS